MKSRVFCSCPCMVLWGLLIFIKRKIAHLGRGLILFGGRGSVALASAGQSRADPTRHRIKMIISSSDWKLNSELMRWRIVIKQRKWSFPLLPVFKGRCKPRRGWNGGLQWWWIAQGEQPGTLKGPASEKVQPSKNTSPEGVSKRALRGKTRECCPKYPGEGWLLLLVYSELTRCNHGAPEFPQDLSPPWLL